MRSTFKKSILDNGMALVTESLPYFQSLSIGVWVNAGTRHEAMGEEGLSHFLEHMMFKGTEKRSALDIAREVDRVGGEFNAFTSREYTCFHLLLLARDLGLACDVMSDVLLNSKFSAEEIERERKVILQEISMVEDNPEELIHDFFFDQAFGGHALGKPILGRPEIIAKFDRPTMVSYFRRHYSPGQIVISVAGDVSHEQARRHLNRALASGSKRLAHGAAHKKANLDTPKIKAGSKILRRELEQAHVLIGFPGISVKDPDRFSAYLLNIYLGGGMSSALFQEIREKRGLAYTIYSSLQPFSDTGLFAVYMGTSPAEVPNCLDIMGRELARLRDTRLAKDVVDTLKDNLKGTILLNSDSVESRMTAIAKNQMFFGKYVPTKDVTREIERVTAGGIQRMARQILDRRKLILSVMGPVKNQRLGEKILKHF